MKLLQGKLTYANVMATIAVFIALGGSAYAATQLKKNSVGTKQLKNNAVTSAKIKNGSVTGDKIKASTLGPVPTATNADNARTLGGQSPGEFQQRVRWALVDRDGTIVSQSGGITVLHDPSGCTPGCYFLNFGSSQAGKAITVTNGGIENGFFITGVCGGNDGLGRTECFSGTADTVNDANHILVLSALAASETEADLPFYVTVTG